MGLHVSMVERFGNKMGMFKNSKEKDDILYKKSTGSNIGINISLGKEESIEQLKSKLFELLSKCDIKMGLLLNTFDLDHYGDFIDLIEDLDEDIHTNGIVKNTQVYEGVEGLFCVLGYKPEIHDRMVTFNRISTRDRVEAVVDISYNVYILDIKLIAYIEDNMDLFNRIPYDAETEDYSVKELAEMCSLLSNVRFNNFEIEMR